MVSNRITKWIINHTFLLAIITFIFGFSLSYIYNKYIINDYIKEYENFKLESNTNIKNAENKIDKQTKYSDSISILLSAKKQNIINNRYYYEIHNETIANYNDSITDSLFKANLQSDYKRFGYLLNRK